MNKLELSYNWVAQIILGSRFFSLPVLHKIRNLSYSKYLGCKCKVSHGVLIWSEHKAKGRIICEDPIIINSGCFFDSTGVIRFIGGGRTVISQGVSIFTHKHEITNQHNTCQALNKYIPTETIIERNVWIGANSVILPSCHRIGEGSVIGSGSIVTKDVPAFTIVAGNPAKVIRSI